MSWTSPKTTWQYSIDANGNYVGDYFNLSDMLRISENLLCLKEMAIQYVGTCKPINYFLPRDTVGTNIFYTKLDLDPEMIPNYKNEYAYSLYPWLFHYDFMMELYGLCCLDAISRAANAYRGVSEIQSSDNVWIDYYMSAAPSIKYTGYGAVCNDIDADSDKYAKMLWRNLGLYQYVRIPFMLSLSYDAGAAVISRIVEGTLVNNAFWGPDELNRIEGAMTSVYNRFLYGGN